MKNKTLRKSNCAPNKTRRISNSCFTKSALLTLKEEYNKDNQNSTKITSKNPKQIWKDLKNYHPNCSKEKCWIQNIGNKTIKNKLEKLYFAPDKPKSWSKNPNEWLSNFDIKHVLDQYSRIYKNFAFIGPTPIDFDAVQSGTCIWEELCKFDLQELITQGKNKIGIIFNLDPHNKPGSHWVSLFIDTKNKYIMYFDSNGITCPPEICNLIQRIIIQGKSATPSLSLKEIQNKYQHQYTNTECGMYSLYFIITHLTEKINQKNASHKKVVEHFTNKRIPDNYVFALRGKYFN